MFARFSLGPPSIERYNGDTAPLRRTLFIPKLREKITSSKIEIINYKLEINQLSSGSVIRLHPEQEQEEEEQRTLCLCIIR